MSRRGESTNSVEKKVARVRSKKEMEVQSTRQMNCYRQGPLKDCFIIICRASQFFFVKLCRRIRNIYLYHNRRKVLLKVKWHFFFQLARLQPSEGEDSIYSESGTITKRLRRLNGFSQEIINVCR